MRKNRAKLLWQILCCLFIIVIFYFTRRYEDIPYKGFQGLHIENAYNAINVCDCYKSAKLNLLSKESDKISLNQTYCSPKAYDRGSNQKIVAFAYYGTEYDQNTLRKYFEGIEANAKLMKKFYPGWTLR